MRPTTFLEPLHGWPRHLAGTVKLKDEKDPFIPERLNLLRGYKIGETCPGYLFHFLIGTDLKMRDKVNPPIATESKRLQANRLYRLLQEEVETPGRLANVQSEDPGLIPTIRLGPDSLPRDATYDVICSTDDPNAVNRLHEGFADPNRKIRGLWLQFGANPVPATDLKKIKSGLEREQTLSAIDLTTDSANTVAEAEVFRGIGRNPNIVQLRVIGDLAAGHRKGVIDALSSDKLAHVSIDAHEESLAAHVGMGRQVAPSVADVSERKSLWVVHWPRPGQSSVKDVAKLNAAVVRLAESGSTKSLHLDPEVKECLTPETLEAARTARMDVFES